jgi:hypothetical protein
MKTYIENMPLKASNKPSRNFVSIIIKVNKMPDFEKLLYSRRFLLGCTCSSALETELTICEALGSIPSMQRFLMTLTR